MSDAFRRSKSFRDRADSAAFYEAWVGSVLARAGLYTAHYPFSIREDGQPGEDFSKSHDLDVWSNPHRCSQVEVKSVNFAFSGPEDYPYNPVLLCSQSSFLKKWPGMSTTGRHFIIVSRMTGSMVWVPEHTPVTLGHEVVDGTRGEMYKAVVVGKYSLRDLQGFVSMVKHEKEF